MPIARATFAPAYRGLLAGLLVLVFFASVAVAMTSKSATTAPPTPTPATTVAPTAGTDATNPVGNQRGGFDGDGNGRRDGAGFDRGGDGDFR